LFAVVVGIYEPLERSRHAVQAGGAYGYALRDAFLSARLMAYNGPVGVKVASSSITVFSGSSYAARTTAHDVQYPLPSNLTITGVTEVVFSPFTGTANTTGTTTFVAGFATTTVNLGANGVVTISS